MWMVWDDQNGLVGTFDNKEEAQNEYEAYKSSMVDYFDGEFNGDEHIILAKIEKQIYSRDTKDPVLKIDTDGNEYRCNEDTYWEFKEETL